MRIKLTKRAIDAARYERETGAHYLWDTETAGFGLRVYPSGRKAFVITYRVRGKQRFYTLGRFGELTLYKARTKALEALARAREGDDPAADRRSYRRAPTLEELCARYMKEHAEVHRKPASVKLVERLWRLHILPKLGHRKVVDITRGDIQTLHSSLADTPGAANQTRQLLSKALDLAEVWGWRTGGSNPCRHVKDFRMEKRERYLSESELGRLCEVLAELERTQAENPFVIAAVRLLILTGCRVSEILKLRWQEVDFENRCLRLPDSKTGPKVVYLNPPALQLLSGIEPVEDNEYVIPGRFAGRRLSHLTAQWSRIRKSAGLEDLRIHDLRHSYASFGVGLGVPIQVVGKLLGHAEISTTQRYAHLSDDPIRQANQRIGDHIWAVMSGKPKAEVVEITDGQRATAG